MFGTLYLVATPIGNLGDITLRALRILKEVDFIACEDTRVSIKLLNHYDIKKKLISYYKFNQKKQEDYLIELLQKGGNIALISDAGTPAISDPGEFLTARCIKENIKISPIPGPCAFIAALTSSGIETSEFVFLSYSPSSRSEVLEFFENIKNEKRTIIFYETPHRLKNNLEIMLKTLGNRKICLAKEVTKIHENFTTDTIENILSGLPDKIKGEYIIIVEGNKCAGAQEPKPLPQNDEIINEIKKYKNTPAKELVKIIAEKYNISRNEAYKLVIKSQN